jgi:hypothetical protein
MEWRGGNAQDEQYRVLIGCKEESKIKDYFDAISLCPYKPKRR